MGSPDKNAEHGKILSDIGEFELIRDVIFSTASLNGVESDLGDDCAYVDVGHSTLAVTADAGPKPLIHILPGRSEDHEAAGWHAVVATASDIATAGARPLCIVNTIDAPPELEVASLRRYMNGIFRACREFGFKSGGGDIRQGKALSAKVFGIGAVDHGVKIGRSGVQDGDRLLLIGSAGKFISNFLEAERIGFSNIDASAAEYLRFPPAQVQSMQILASHGLIVAASDSSDGVLGAIANIVSSSQCRAVLNLRDEMLGTKLLHEAEIRSYSPWNLFFFWGDWSIVAAVRASKMKEFSTIADAHGIAWTELGQVDRIGQILHGTVDATINGSYTTTMTIVRNENFSAKGFNRGIREHVEYMLTEPIFDAADSGSTSRRDHIK